MINDLRIDFRSLSKIRNFDINDVRGKNLSDHVLSMIAELKENANGFSVVIQVNDAPVSRADNGFVKKMAAFLASLTKREMEVYTLAMKGYRNKDIAGELFIEVETVRTHRTSIVGKAGVANIKELRTQILAANGLIGK